jgi:hypothetical protein
LNGFWDRFLHFFASDVRFADKETGKAGSVSLKKFPPFRARQQGKRIIRKPRNADEEFER